MVAQIARQMRERISRMIGKGGKMIGIGNRGADVDTD